MSDYITRFTQKNDREVYTLYQALLDDNVRPEDIDAGYKKTYFINHDNPEQIPYEFIGAHDHILDPHEVQEYVFNHWSRYQDLIQNTYSYPVPWLLDDLDNQTTFDFKVRSKFNWIISSCKKYLKGTKQLSEESDEYKKNLAILLFCFSICPASQWINDDNFLWQTVCSYLEVNNLADAVPLFTENGGFFIDSNFDSVIENTALEALQKNQGECTEKSYILWAIFHMAGLGPECVFTDMCNVVEYKPELFQLVSNQQMDAHFCVKIVVNNQDMLFDSSLLLLDPKYKSYQTVSLRQVYVAYMTNALPLVYEQEGIEIASDKIDTALTIDDSYYCTYINRINWLAETEGLKAAIPMYEKASQHTVQTAQNELAMSMICYNNQDYDKCIFFAQKALANKDYLFMANHVLCLAYYELNNFDAMIESSTNGLAKNPNYTPFNLLRAYANLKKGDPAKAIEDLNIIQDSSLKNVFSPFELILYVEKWAEALRDHGQMEEAEAVTDEFVQSFPQEAVPYLLKARFELQLGRCQSAFDLFNKGLRINFLSLTDYYNILSHKKLTKAEFKNKENDFLAKLGFESVEDQEQMAFFMMLFWIHFGDYKKASDYIDNAVNNFPQNNDLLANKAMLSCLNGNNKLGLSLLTKALQNNETNLNTMELISLLERFEYMLHHTIPNPLAKHDAYLITSYALWNNNQKELAAQLFKKAQSTFSRINDDKMSEDLKTHLTQMTSLMPIEMQNSDLLLN